MARKVDYVQEKRKDEALGVWLNGPDGRHTTAGIFGFCQGFDDGWQAHLQESGDETLGTMQCPRCHLVFNCPDCHSGSGG